MGVMCMEIRKEDNKITIIDPLEGLFKRYLYKYTFEKKEGRIVGTLKYPRKSYFETRKLDKDEMIKVLESLIKEAKDEEDYKTLKELLEEVKKNAWEYKEMIL